MDQQQATGRPGQARERVEQTLGRQRLFREVNEEIARLSTSIGGSDDETLSVLCECATGCAELITLIAREFDEIRQHPARFILKAGHEQDGRQTAVVARSDGYVVVEKPDLAHDA